MNNNKKDAKTAYRPYGYAIGKKIIENAIGKLSKIFN